MSIVILDQCKQKLPPAVSASYYQLALAAFPKATFGNAGTLVVAGTMVVAGFSGVCVYLIVIADTAAPIAALVFGIPPPEVNRLLLQILSMMLILPLASKKKLDSLAFASMLSLFALFYVACAVTWRGVLHMFETGSP
jgi:amino acid permease